jgi:hypothetical protein
MGLAFADYGALGQCACSGTIGGFGGGAVEGCGQLCAKNLCKQKAISSDCFACAMTACPAEASACFGM